MLLALIQRYIETHQLVPAGADILVGVSGGIDSMVLLYVLQKLGYNVSCAHVNYMQRGTSSEADQALVEAFCEDYKIPCAVHRVSDAFLQEARGVSFQESAREERYAFFQQVAFETMWFLI